MSQMYKNTAVLSMALLPLGSSVVAGGPYSISRRAEEELEMFAMVMANSKLGF